MLNKQKRDALFLAIHEAIEGAAAKTAKDVVSGTADLAYPPNHGFSAREVQALEQIPNSEALEGALRKVIASAAAAPLFQFFCLLDGVADPPTPIGAEPSLWLGATIELRHAEDEPGDDVDFLHDDFYDTYWAWRAVRPDPGWRLDIYDGPVVDPTNLDA